MTKVLFGAVGIQGNVSGNLDAIDIDSVKNKDMCITIEGNKLFFYRMNQYSGEEENYPYVIKPSQITDESALKSIFKRWELVSQKYLSSNIKQIVGKYIQTHNIKSISNEDIEIEASNGNKVIISSDGDVTFPLQVSGIDPVQNSHITTVLYLDLKLSELEDYISDYLDTGSDELREEIINRNTDLITIDSWSFSDGLYYYDIEHNLSDENIMLEVWEGDYIIEPVKVENISSDIIRIYNESDNILKVRIFYESNE